MSPASIGRRCLLVLALLAVVPAGPIRAAADSAVIAPIQGLYDQLLTVMKAGSAGASFAQRFNMLAPAVDQAIDMPTILQVSCGAIWRTMSADEQDALMVAFRQYTIATYVNSFDSFSGQRFTVDPETRSIGANQIVQSQIIPAKGDSHQLDYVMRQSGASWKAVDVLAEGSISRVATQRSDFRSLLMRGGGQALLTSLQQKASSLGTSSQ